jgi:hypothetical protein
MPSQALNDSRWLSPLPQESYVSLEKQLQVIHTILQQRDAISAHAKGKARNFLRVITIILHEFEHVGIDHAAAENLNPSRLLARTARCVVWSALPAAAADDARNKQLRTRLSKWKE